MTSGTAGGDPSAGPRSVPVADPRGAGVGATIARNAVFTVVGRMFFLLAWALITPFMLKVLGEDRFAIWALFFAVSGYFTTFDLGLSQSLVKFVAQFSASGDARALRGVVTLGMAIYFVLTAPVVIVLALFQRQVLDLIHTPAAIRPEAGWALVGMAVVLGLNNLGGVLTAVLTGKQRMDVTNRIQLLVTAIQIAGVIAVLRAGWGLRGLVAAYGAGIVVTAILSWRSMRTIEPEARFDPRAMSRGLLRELFHFSSALQITNLGVMVQFQLDKFLLAHFATLAIVARFELGFRLAAAAWAVPLLILPPLVPAVTQLGTLDDHARILRLYSRASRYLAAVAFPLAAFTIVAAPALVTGWLGPGYPEAVWTLIGLISFLLITILTGVGTAVCRGTGAPWMEAHYHLIGIVVHVALSLWLVPRWGLGGALLALNMSGAVAVVFFLWRFHGRIGEPLGQWLRDVVAVPLAASLGASVLVVLWRGGFMTPFAARMAALLDVGKACAVFAIVIGVTYLSSRFVTLAEIKELRRGVVRG